MRVNLVGRRQRQTFELMGEFYTCIQHISVSGLRVRGMSCTLSGGRGQAVGGAGGWSLGVTREKQCSMCGSSRGGGGEHEVTGKLVRCGWCKTEWYCGKECREKCPYPALSSTFSSLLYSSLWLFLRSVRGQDSCTLVPVAYP